MAKPSTLPQWESNGTNETDPPSAYKTDGWGGSTRKKANSLYQNWAMRWAYEWLKWLKNNARHGVISDTLGVGPNHNYNPAGLADAKLIRISGGVSIGITGITAPASTDECAEITIVAIGAGTQINLNNENAGSAAANRIINWLDGSASVGENGSWTVVYDHVTQRWRVKAFMDPP